MTTVPERRSATPKFRSVGATRRQLGVEVWRRSEGVERAVARPARAVMRIEVSCIVGLVRVFVLV